MHYINNGGKKAQKTTNRCNYAACVVEAWIFTQFLNVPFHCSSHFSLHWMCSQYQHKNAKTFCTLSMQQQTAKPLNNTFSKSCRYNVHTVSTTHFETHTFVLKSNVPFTCFRFLDDKNYYLVKTLLDNILYKMMNKLIEILRIW